MRSPFRDPVAMIFIDADNRELARLTDTTIVPRVGENVRLAKIPYLIERIGYDVHDGSITQIWIVCREA